MGDFVSKRRGAGSAGDARLRVARRRRPPLLRLASPYDAEAHVREAAPDNSKLHSGRRRKIDDAPGNVGATVVDPDRDRPSGIEIDDAQTGAERQRPVSGGQLARIE